LIRVLVTDGEQRSALAAVRSLGRAGYAPFVCSRFERSLAGASRHVRSQLRVPDPLSDPGGYVDQLRRLVDHWRIRVLLPMTEASLLALLPQRQRFSGVCIPFPSIETFLAVSDKARLLDAASRVGIRVPEQRVVAAPSDLAGAAGRDLQFPVVLKPARSVGEGGSGRVKLEVRHAAGPAELRRELDALPEAAFPLLLQRRIVGPGVGIFLLRWSDRWLGAFSHRRLREKPPSGGISVYCESVAADPGLLDRSRALLERFGWQGVAMVEFKLDATTGEAFLMEVNGRFWGSLQLAVDSGVDFPRLLVDAAVGRNVAPVTTYRTGVRSRWWWGDVDHLLARVRRSAAELDLPPGSPSRARAILEFLRLWRPGDRNEVFRLDDPGPLLRETLHWFARR
jgi:predicted ATP-grasp superfamily ATP-dependent carboligase